MSSNALQAWRSGRSARIAELLAAHRALRGTGARHRSGTTQVTWALTLRLAGEFQGFARALHDEAAAYAAFVIAANHPDFAGTVTASLTVRRDLDRGNAHPASLNNDFARYVDDFWGAMDERDSRMGRWRRDLDTLNRARNAIAHSQEDKLAALAVDGYPMTLHTIRLWRASLNGIAKSMDDVVGQSLATRLGPPAPW